MVAGAFTAEELELRHTAEGTPPCARMAETLRAIEVTIIESRLAENTNGNTHEAGGALAAQLFELLAYYSYQAQMQSPRLASCRPPRPALKLVRGGK